MNPFAADLGTGGENGPMMQIDVSEIQQQALCGQAEMVLDNLARSHSLPSHLSLTIEEILERAWEIAYCRRDGSHSSNVIVVSHWRRPDDSDGNAGKFQSCGA